MQLLQEVQPSFATQLTQDDSFQQKVTYTLQLTEEFKRALLGSDILQTFTRLRKETSELFDAALQDKIKRISLRRKFLIAQHVDEAVKKAQITRAEQEESEAFHEKIQRAEEIVEAVGTCVIEALKNFTSPLYAAAQDEDMCTSIVDSLHWSALTLSRPQYRCQIAYARNLLETGKSKEALTVLHALSSFFPKDLNAQFTEIMQTQSKEELSQRLKLFLFENKDLLDHTLSEIEEAFMQKTSFTDLMEQGSIIETFLKYLPFSTLHTAINQRNFRKLIGNSFPIEFFSKRARNIPYVPLFSLTTVPKVCCECDMVVYNAMLRNGREFGLLSKELQKNITVIKLALISILSTRESVEKKELFIQELLQQIPEPTRIEIAAKIALFIKTVRYELNVHPQIPLKNKDRTFSFLVQRFPRDEDLCSLAVEVDGLVLRNVPLELQNTKAFVQKAVRQNGLALEFANLSFKNDEEIVSLAVQQNGLALEHASLELQNNEKIVSLAVQQNGLALQFASPRLKTLEKIVFIAIQQAWQAIEFASEILRNNEKLISFAILHSEGKALQYASPELKKNEKIVVLAVQQKGSMLYFAGEELKNNESIVALAVQRYGYALDFASAELKNNERIVALAVQANGNALDFASVAFKNNEKIVSLAVQSCGRALKFASKRLQNDENIVSLAVQQDGKALEFANSNLQNNENIVSLAVQQNGLALEFASLAQKNNQKVVTLALKQNINAIKYIGHTVIVK